MPVVGRCVESRARRNGLADGLLWRDSLVWGSTARRASLRASDPAKPLRGRDGFCDVHGVFFAGQEALLNTFASASLVDLARHGSKPSDGGTAAEVTDLERAAPIGDATAG